MKTALLVASVLACLGAHNAPAAETFPPGWVPVNVLDEKPTWKAFREIKDKIHLYFPNGDKPVRGVFVSFVFHSGDPREMADLWDFALVTVPWAFEYDLGHNDKRNGRFKAGHEKQDMGLLLRYLDAAAKQTKHPELSTVPLVGWIGQNGSHLCADLYKRSPGRLLAWSDSFPDRLRQFSELTRNVPFPFAWEISKGDLRAGARSYKKDKNPPADLSCRASTYGFSHGIYSKYNFFMFYIDRCIKLRMPKKMPPPGEPVTLKPIVREEGWVGDFDPIGGWNPIESAKAGKLKPKYPVWFPDEYAAWAWRSYHSSNTDIEMTSPRFTYGTKRAKKGPDWGLGYGGRLSASDQHVISAETQGDYVKMEFRDGHQVLGEVAKAPWKLEGVTLKAGLHVLFAVGIRADGSRSACRPAIIITR